MIRHAAKVHQNQAIIFELYCLQANKQMNEQTNKQTDGSDYITPLFAGWLPDLPSIHRSHILDDEKHRRLRTNLQLLFDRPPYGQVYEMPCKKFTITGNEYTASHLSWSIDSDIQSLVTKYTRTIFYIVTLSHRPYQLM